jgi:hypothetical protein
MSLLLTGLFISTVLALTTVMLTDDDRLDRV